MSDGTIERQVTATMPDLNRELIASILNKTGRDSRNASRPPRPLSFEALADLLTDGERRVITQLMAIDPRDVGFNGPFIGYEGPPSGLAAIDGQQFVRDGRTRTIPTQYLPRHVLNAFQLMQTAMHQEIGVRLMAESGYRSPAQQALTFLTYLERNNYDVHRVARGVALPGFSQHGDSLYTAIDVIDEFGVPTDTDPQLFALSPAYSWMTANADRFGFHLSYPPDNEDGIKFEPWHWRYVGPIPGQDGANF